MTDVTANQAPESAESARRPSPVRDRLDDIDYDIDYELEIDDVGDGGE